MIVHYESVLSSGAAGTGRAVRFDRPDVPDLHEARERIETLARILDSAVTIPGTSVKLGADALLNLVPGVGTLAAKGLSSYIIYEARRLGVPTTTLLRMAGNVGLDFVISAIPIVGWFGDVFFRSNQRNIALLRQHLDRRIGSAAIVLQEAGR
jgi:hypothetical protein